MAVEKEELAPSDVLSTLDTKVTCVRRQANGKWTIEIEVDVDAELPDGRRLTGKGFFNISNIKQRGRKGAMV